MGQNGAREGSVQLMTLFPCSICCNRWGKDGSAAVACVMSDQEMALSSWVSLWMDAIRADSTRSGRLGGMGDMLFRAPEGDGCLDVASAAWLHLPGRCCISNRHGRVRCLRLNRRELVISSNVRHQESSVAYGR